MELHFDVTLEKPVSCLCPQNVIPCMGTSMCGSGCLAPSGVGGGNTCPGRSRLIQSKRLELGKCCESEFGSCETKASPFPSLCHFLEVARGNSVLRSEGQTLVKKALAGRESGGLQASTGMLVTPRQETLWESPTRSTFSSGC